MKLKLKTYKTLFILGMAILSSNSSFTQTNSTIEGSVLDKQSKTALPYVNILIAKTNRGTITNEKGTFSIDTRNLNPTDTIKFQFIGYKTQNITIDNLKKTNKVILSENVMTIDEVIISNKKINPEDIVKNVLKNSDSNYNKSFHKDQIFVRERYITDVNKIELGYKKSTIKELNKETLQRFQDKTPKHSTSYIDLLANFYIDGASSTIKLDPIKAVELTSKNLAELENYKAVFDTLFYNTNEKEYWKIKSGIFGQKLDIPKDTVNKPVSSNSMPIENFKYQIEEKTQYVTLEDKDLWEFLHKPNRYIFELDGITRSNGEPVYIITFKPKTKGTYEGKLFITTDTYALLKATYEYSQDKRGKNFNFLGVGYTETDFKGSIYFEKKSNIYELKYFSFNKSYNIRINRKISLLKKKNRFLFDKKLKELKLNLQLNLQVQEAIEYFSINNKAISDTDFNNFEEKKRTEVISIDQFDDNLWEGYDIIEPTKQLKNYKKLK